MANQIKCGNCGYVNAAAAQFCGNCGYVLESPAPNPAPVAPSVYCPHCESPNLPGAAFCGECGRPLPGGRDEIVDARPATIACSNCGRANPARATFCGECGHSLSERVAPVGTTSEPGGRRWLSCLLVAVGLLVVMVFAGFILLPRLGIGRAPAAIGQADPGETPDGGAKKDDEPATSVPATSVATPVDTALVPATDIPVATATDRPTLTPFPTPTRPPATATPRPSPTTMPDKGPEHIVLGRTSRGTPIEAVRFGNGPTTLIFIGGMAAGFAPSTVALAEAFVDHFTTRPELIPENVTAFIVLSASPDAPVVAGNYSGRLNANGVDINRNWDCQWAADTIWQGEVKRGSGGTAPFSEAEAHILRDFIQGERAAGVIFWQARAEGGLASPGGCGERVKVSASLAGIYGLNAGYRVENFEDLTRQTLNGDASNWLDSVGIPAVSVLLPHYSSSIDWENNLNGTLAVLNEYAE